MNNNYATINYKKLEKEKFDQKNDPVFHKKKENFYENNLKGYHKPKPENYSYKYKSIEKLNNNNIGLGLSDNLRFNKTTTTPKNINLMDDFNQKILDIKNKFDDFNNSIKIFFLFLLFFRSKR